MGFERSISKGDLPVLDEDPRCLDPIVEMVESVEVGVYVDSEESKP